MFFCGLNRSITIKYQMYIISKLHKKIPLNNAHHILKKKDTTELSIEQKQETDNKT